MSSFFGPTMPGKRALSREDHGRARGYLGELLDEHRALGAQVVDDELVVHDLVAHIDRRAVELERALDDGDRPIDARAEAARLGEQDLDLSVHAFSRCHGFPPRAAACPPVRRLSQTRIATPIVIAESATLNAGQ